VTWTPIADVAPTALVSVVLSVPRLLAFMLVAPVFTSAVFPRLLRVGIAIGLGAPVAAGIFHQLSQQPPQAQLTALVLKECVLGLLLGLALAAPLWAISSVGALTDNQRGANAAQQVTPFAQADASELGGALQLALIVLLATSGTFVAMYQLLLQSFQAWPVLQLAPDVTQFGFDLTASRIGEYMQRALLYAAPLLAIVLLVDFAFALMSVFAPQLQTYFASMPIKSLAALAILALYLFVLLSHGEGYFLEVLRRESQLLESRSP
jgi:type III secretion protein T